MILTVVLAVYGAVALSIWLRLLLAPDTTPVFYGWRALLLCLFAMTLVSALWPVALACEALLETADDDEREVRP